MDPLDSVYGEMNISQDVDQQKLIKNAFFVIKNYVKEPIICIGDGDGWTTNYFKSEIGPDITGLSINSTDCKNAKELFNLDFIQADMQSIPVQDKTYQTIWSRHSIEHCTSPFNALKEMNRILKDDGKIVLIVPYPLDILIFAESHLYVLDDKQWRNLFIKNGLNVVVKLDKFYYNGYAEVLYILEKNNGN